MHHIQQKILQKLLYAQDLGYTQMRPPGIESNHFAYHLERLVQTGLVTKTDRRYSLSPQGLALVDRLSHKKMAERPQPQIVTAIDITTHNGRSLVFRKSFQPYIHRVSFPLGKIHLEETIPQAAVRELEEKSGLTGIALAHRGIVFLESKIQGITISKVMYHLFSGSIEAPLPTSESYRGSCAWTDPATLRPDECIPGFLAMKSLLETQTTFFFREITDEQIDAPLSKPSMQA